MSYYHRLCHSYSLQNSDQQSDRIPAMYNFVHWIVLDGIGILQEFFKDSCRNNSWSRDGCYCSCSKQMASEFFKNSCLNNSLSRDGCYRSCSKQMASEFFKNSVNSNRILVGISAGQVMDAIILVQSRWHRNSSRIPTEFLTEKQLVKSSGNWYYHSCS